MNDYSRQPVDVYIGLGSNLDNPTSHIEKARQAVASLDGAQENGFSSLYSSPPMGPQDQPDYINAVMCIKTDLTPHELLKQLQAIENRQGRVRLQRWGARTLDLDILLYGNDSISTEDLIIPHIGLAERAFVLYPLQEMAGDELSVPGLGVLGDLLKKCPKNGLKKLT